MAAMQAAILWNESSPWLWCGKLRMPCLLTPITDIMTPFAASPHWCAPHLRTLLLAYAFAQLLYLAIARRLSLSLPQILLRPPLSLVLCLPLTLSLSSTPSIHLPPSFPPSRLPSSTCARARARTHTRAIYSCFSDGRREVGAEGVDCRPNRGPAPGLAGAAAFAVLLIPLETGIPARPACRYL